MYSERMYYFQRQTSYTIYCIFLLGMFSLQHYYFLKLELWYNAITCFFLLEGTYYWKYKKKETNVLISNFVKMSYVMNPIERTLHISYCNLKWFCNAFLRLFQIKNSDTYFSVVSKVIIFHKYIQLLSINNSQTWCELIVQ